MKSYFEQEEWYREFLAAEEHVLWTGKTERAFAFYPIYLFVIPFMCVWCGGVITATVSILKEVISGGENPLSLLFMLPFWAGGSFFVYMLLIRPVIRRKNTRYAVTNKRVMEYYKGSFNALFTGTHTPVSISKISKRGTGTVTVGYQNGPYNSNLSLKLPVLNNGIIEITDIAEPRKVYDLIVNQGET